MVKRIIVAMLFSILIHSGWFGNNFQELTSSLFQKTIPSSKHVFIFFYSPKCKTCDKPMSYFEKLPENENALYFKFNGQYNPELLKNFKTINQYPTLAHISPFYNTITNIFPDHAFENESNLKNWIDDQISTSFFQKILKLEMNLNSSLKGDEKIIRDYKNQLINKAENLKDLYETNEKLVIELNSTLRSISEKKYEIENNYIFFKMFIKFFSGIALGFGIVYYFNKKGLRPMKIEK